MSEVGEIQLQTPLSVESANLKTNSLLRNIATRAFGFCWDKGISSNEIVFPTRENRVAVGVETVVPIQFADVREDFRNLVRQYANEKQIAVSDEHLDRLAKKYDEGHLYLGMMGRLPENIKRIRVLDMSSEEALPIRQRQMESKILPFHSITRKLNHKTSEHNIIDRLLVQLEMHNALSAVSKRTEALDLIFGDLFPDEKSREAFKTNLRASNAAEIVIIHGHGGDDNTVGEQGWEFKGPKNQYVDPHIDLEKLVESYDDPDRVAAIVVHTCYVGKMNPPVRRIPVYRFWGHAGMAGIDMHPSKTIIFEPKQGSVSPRE